MVGMIGRVVGLGAAGAGGYTAAQAQRSADDIGSVFNAVGNAGSSAANGLGAFVGSIQSGFASTYNPAPRVTHVYHPGGSNGNVSWGTIVTLSGATVIAVGTVCWWRGWDLFGVVSHARTRRMLGELQAGVGNMRSWAGTQFQSMAGKIDDSAKEQRRQGNVLENVSSQVDRGAAALDSVGLQGEETQQMLRHLHASARRRAIAQQMLILAIVNGTVGDRETAIKHLRQSVLEDVDDLNADGSLLHNGSQRPQLRPRTPSVKWLPGAVQRNVLKPLRSWWGTSEGPASPKTSSEGSATGTDASHTFDAPQSSGAPDITFAVGPEDNSRCGTDKGMWAPPSNVVDGAPPSSSATYPGTDAEAEYRRATGWVSQSFSSAGPPQGDAHRQFTFF